MDEQVVAEINRVLFRLNQDFNSQSNTVKKQLLKIQEAISDMETVYASSKEAMRDSAINISNLVYPEKHFTTTRFLSNMLNSVRHCLTNRILMLITTRPLRSIRTKTAF